MTGLERPGATAPPGTALLSVERLRVQYGGVVAVNDVSFELHRGVLTGLIGPNGAGKTSLVDALSGVAPAGGEVELLGRSIGGWSAHRRARAGIGRTFQSIELFEDLTVVENLLAALDSARFMRSLGDVVRRGRRGVPDDVSWALSVVGLEAVGDRYPKVLSHGQRKLVGVARALVRRPLVVLLDEPAAGLDSDETLELAESLQSLEGHGVTALLIDHDMSLVMGVCDRVMVLDFGELISFGTPAEVRGDPRVVNAYLGQEAA